MQLLTPAQLAALPPLYSQEHVADPLVVCKFFDPSGSWSRFVLEGQPAPTEEADDDALLFALVQGHEVELGYVALSELRRYRGPLGLGLERDLHWTPTPLSVVRENLDRF